MKNILRKFGRLPRRIYEDFAIIRQVKNWRSFLMAKLKRKRINSMTLRNGIVVFCPGEIDLNFLFHEIFIDKVYNPKGYEIHEGDTIIDIGGNIGMFAVFVATRQPDVRVFSFEPFPSNAAYFTKNTGHKKLTGIKLQEKAVTGKPGTRFLNISDVWSSHSLGSNGNPFRSIEVKCTTLNDILDETGRCNLLKTDCEGSEYEILYSTTKDNLKKIHKIVGEYHNNELGTGTELMRFLEANSFRVDVFRELDQNIGMFCATNLAYG